MRAVTQQKRDALALLTPSPCRGGSTRFSPPVSCFIPRSSSASTAGAAPRLYLHRSRRSTNVTRHKGRLCVSISEASEAEPTDLKEERHEVGALSTSATASAQVELHNLIVSLRESTGGLLPYGRLLVVPMLWSTAIPAQTALATLEHSPHISLIQFVRMGCACLPFVPAMLSLTAPGTRNGAQQLSQKSKTAETGGNDKTESMVSEARDITAEVTSSTQTNKHDVKMAWRGALV